MLRVASALILCVLLSACHDDDPLKDPTAPTGTANASPVISGSPQSVAMTGQTYSFHPSATDANHDPLTFKIQNKPMWATFDSKTGILAGTPIDSHRGVTSGIVISVTDGKLSASLAGFSIAVNADAEAPTIAGTPRASVAVGAHYNFLPSASDPNGEALTFSIQNKPSWATFDSDTGELAGVAPAASIGTFANILISVSNSHANATLAPFSIAVNQMEAASATLSWTPPTENVDGSALTNLAGYKIFYGRKSTTLDQVVEVKNPGLTTYVLSNLTSATWYFSIKAVTSSKLESELSPIVAADI